MGPVALRGLGSPFLARNGLAMGQFTTRHVAKTGNRP